MGWIFYRHWLGMVISSLLSVVLKPVYEAYRLDDQRKRGYGELRDLLYVLSSGFASGRGLKEGIRDGCRTLRNSYGDKSLFASETESMLQIMEEGNASEVELFRNFAVRCGFPELKQVASMYQLCLSTGGDLPKAMIETSDSMLRRLQMYQEIQAKTAQKRLEFTIMIVMVPVLLIAVNGTSDYLGILYQTLQGRIVMTAAMIGLITAFLWTMKILEDGKR